MSVQVEKLEKNMAKLTVEVPVDEVEKAVNNVYLRTRSSIAMPGFRKGKAPRKMIERLYGAGVFLEDAANDLIPAEYNKAMTESGLDIVSQPSVEVVQLEPGKPFIFTAQVAVRPEVTLGQYKGVEVPKIEISVSDEEIDKEIEREREKNSRYIPVEDRGAENGDRVTLDFDGSVDGVPFEGGKGSDYPLTLGSNTFIPGFEEQLIGVKPEDHLDVNVTFPEEYQEKSLAGKDAVFACDIKKVEVKELPELDDEFAQDVSEFDTLEEYRTSVLDTLKKRKEEEKKRTIEDAAVEKVIDNAEMEIPDAMIDTQARQLMDEFTSRLQMQGLSMEQYFQFTGQSFDMMMEESKPQALKQIQTRLVLEKIVEAENIQVSDEELDSEIEKMAASYRMEADKMKESLNEEMLKQIRKDVAVQKAITLVAEEAKEV